MYNRLMKELNERLETNNASINFAAMSPEVRMKMISRNDELKEIIESFVLRKDTFIDDCKKETTKIPDYQESILYRESQEQEQTDKWRKRKGL
jgi:hypothetical protein